ncbi:MAG TPA: VOC family protein [Gammaproteobacteria bacterium]|jgi:catechol 2,3-dioxygenase-like lactoylglutathione lyase family enzyme|nr:VOC family protein [Gammaproteobacteria bacterium]
MKRLASILLFGFLTTAAHAQQAPAPTGLVVGSGNFFSPIVRDLDKAVAFYRDGLGLETQGEPGNADKNENLRRMFGLPEAKIRWMIARPAGMRSGVEIVEISGVGGKPLVRRPQDSGAYTLIAFVRDMDGTLARLKAQGTRIVSASGAPVSLPLGAGQNGRMITVADPDGHFVEIVQPDKVPETAGASNVYDVRVRLAVQDVEKAAHLYHDELGLELVNQSTFTDNPTVAGALGVPGAQFRFAMLKVPTTGLVFEVIDYKGIDRKVVRGDLKDPGSTRIQMQVRDIDAAVAALTKAGGAFVSTGGKPLELPAGNNVLKVGIVREPDNLFVVLIQSPPPAAK